VAVEAGKDLSVRSVRYYWYRADEEPLATHQAKTADFQPGSHGTPFGGKIVVPPEAIGVMRLLAVGEVARGRLDSYEEFDEVLVTVEPTAALSTIEFAVEQPWRLDRIGQLVDVPVVGQFLDGVVRPLAGPKTGSSFRTSDERVAVVDEDGILQVRGNGRMRLTVENRGKVGVLEVLVEADDQPNRAPVAAVETELHARSGALVVLDGIKSRDPDGDPLRYEWKQRRGHRVPLTNVGEVKATFIAPKVSERKRYQFTLTVTDMAGPDTVKGADSQPAVVTVYVSP